MHPEYSLVIAAHVALAIAGSLLALVLAPARLRAGPARRDLPLPGPEHPPLPDPPALLSPRLPERRLPRPSPDAPARLILSAHYDAAKTGLVFGPRSTAHSRAPLRARPGPARPPPDHLLGRDRPAACRSAPPGWPASTPTGCRSSSSSRTAICWSSRLLLLIDIALSEVVPGAYDNASGVAAALSVARGARRRPARRTSTSGSSSRRRGMPTARAWRAWVTRPPRRARPREHLLPQRRLGLLRRSPLPAQRGRDRQLPTSTAAWSSSATRSPQPTARASDRYRARPLRIPFHSDALPASTRGFRAITIVGVEDGVSPPYYHTHDDTPEQARRRRDAPRAIDFAARARPPARPRRRPAGRRR